METICQEIGLFEFRSQYRCGNEELGLTTVYYSGTKICQIKSESILRWVSEWYRGSSTSYGIREFNENNLPQFVEKYSI